MLLSRLQSITQGWRARVSSRTRSVAIGADRVHYQSDLFLNGAVIALEMALVLMGGGAAPLVSVGR